MKTNEIMDELDICIMVARESGLDGTVRALEEVREALSLNDNAYHSVARFELPSFAE